jgi:hypothetical protein
MFALFDLMFIILKILLSKSKIEIIITFLIRNKNVSKNLKQYII